MTETTNTSSYRAQLKEELFLQFHRFLHDPKAAEAATAAILEDQNDQWHTFLMESVAGIALPPPKARDLWIHCFKHWEILCGKLERNPGLFVAVLDCLQNLEAYSVTTKIRIKVSEDEKLEAHRDELTKLIKGDYFSDRILRSISSSKRNRSPFTIGIIQLDQFDLLRTTRGALNTSEVLRKTGSLIIQSIRDIDFAFHLEGPNFAVILPETDRTGAFIVLERIRTRAEIDLKAFQCLLSSGLAIYPEDGETENLLMKRANVALEHSQKSGGNRVCLNPDERRTYPRLNENLMVRIKAINKGKGPSEEAITRDISGSGFAFEHSTVFEKDNPVQGEIELPTQIINFLGKVIRCIEIEPNRYEIAVEFISIDPESRFHLLSFTH